MLLQRMTRIIKIIIYCYNWASKAALVVKNPPANLGDGQETWVQSMNQEDPLEKEMAPHTSILAWKIP